MTDAADEVLAAARQMLDDTAVVDLDADLIRLGMDSLRMVAFMVDLESRFGLRFPQDLIDVSTFRTPRAALEALQSIHSAA